MKLIDRNVPMCFVRLLWFWYKFQSVVMRWGNAYSKPFTAANGVRQASILNPYLFMYIWKLNTLEAGCYIGNICLNHT